MLFYSPEFLVFSIILLSALSLVHRNEPRKLILLIASYIFYMWWNPAFILLIVFATATNFLVARALERESRESRRRVLLTLGLTASLGLLAYFKYAGFLADNALALMRLAGFDVHWTSIHVVLPVGISFYTFQTLSYTIDVYRREIPATQSPTDFALFVAFFPQLVAGPIVRAADFLPQLKTRTRISCDQSTFFLILRGLAKKVLIADNIAIFADRIFENPALFPSIVIWLGTICFAIQIYCDFSGYSDIAIGVSRILGYHIPTNFDHPYLARNPSDFWRRWHISLSTWLRDYLYISLGGNRRGRIRTYFNLMATMLLGGIWHGASWNFVFWGFIHGSILVAHRLYRNIRQAVSVPPRRTSLLKSLLSIAAIQYFVLLAWIPFRVSNTPDLLSALHSFLVFDFDFHVADIGLGAVSLFSTLLLMTAFGILHLVSRRVGHIDRFFGNASMATSCVVCVAAGLAACLLWPMSEVPFIYFQF